MNIISVAFTKKCPFITATCQQVQDREVNKYSKTF